MKKYIRDMKPKEIIENLKKGLQIKLDDSESKFFMVDNIICYIDFEGDLSINESLPCYDAWYFEIDEPFEIKEEGLYKTRDGRKAFISKIDIECKVFPLKGAIQDFGEMVTWTKNGKFNSSGEEHPADLIGEWKD